MNQSGGVKSKNKKTSSGIKKTLFVLFLSVFCLMLGVGGGIVGQLIAKKDAVVDDKVVTNNDRPVVLSGKEVDVVKVVKKVSPSVVSIVAEKKGSTRFARSVSAAGTGIVMSQDGYVITNKHVVNGTDNINVITSDGKEYEEVKLVGVDPLNDVAFLKIVSKDTFKPAEFASSNDLVLGQRVIAIGNALGQYQNTVTTGIVSGVNREVSASGKDDGSDRELLIDLIQTDAAINHGNSGGPLIDSSGRVIGINTAIAEKSQGLGFAIPISATKGMMRGVIEKGKVERAYLGIKYVSIKPAIKKELKLAISQGAYVQSSSDSGSPAAKAGLEKGDIIIKINGDNVGEAGSVFNLVSQYIPGEEVEVTFVRGDKSHKTKITLGTYGDR